MSAITELISKSSQAEFNSTFCPEAVPAEFRLAALALCPLLTVRNGFFAFSSALRVRGMKDGHGGDFIDWNSSSCWRNEFGEKALKLISFGEDVFGNQFCFDGDGFWHFNIETCGRLYMGESVDDWAATVLSDSGYWTGFQLALEWQQLKGALPHGYRLFPRRPFSLGGEYEVENLWAGEVEQVIGYYGFIANQIADLPDGCNVELMLPGGKTISGILQR